MRNSSWYVVICYALLILSCSPSGTEKELPVIRKDSMVSVLVELHLADSVNNSLRTEDLVSKGIDTTYSSQVFANHGVNPERFRTDMQYYVSHPDELVQLYDQVIEQLNQRQRPDRR